jgi:hypothetical protein
VSIPIPPSDQREGPHRREVRRLAAADGEARFFWCCIHGSIMTLETRNALLWAYGFCEHHPSVHLSVEMSFWKRHFLRPVILFRALVVKSVQAIDACQRIGLGSSSRRLRQKGSRFLNALSIGHAGAGVALPTRRRDGSAVRSFATDLAALWRPKVGTMWLGEMSGPSSCRPHLLPDLNPIGPPIFLGNGCCSNRLCNLRGDGPADQDRAALISAAGCWSGCHPLSTFLIGRLSRRRRTYGLA